MKGPIVVLGSLNADIVVRLPHFPAPGETVTGTDLAVFPGGKGANQACAAGRLGARCPRGPPSSPSTPRARTRS